MFAPETVKGWKASYSVGNCINCNDNLIVKDDETRSFQTVSVENTTCGSSCENISARKVSPKGKVATSKRKYLDLSQRVDLLTFRKRS